MRRGVLQRFALTIATAMCLSVPGTARQANPTLSIEDVTVAEGDSGTSVATFRVVLRNPNLVETRIHYVTADGSATAAALTQSSGPLAIPANGSASPYPATINVSGLTGTVQHVAVRLNSLTHTFPADLDVLLVGPGGQAAMVMSDIGIGNDVNNITLTFQDGAPTPPPQLVTGTFAPADNAPPEAAMPAPAPVGPYGSALSVFNGTNPNGAWRLFVTDDSVNPDGGSLGSFSIIITTTTNGGDYVPTAGLLTFPPGIPARTLQVPIKGDCDGGQRNVFRQPRRRLQRGPRRRTGHGHNPQRRRGCRVATTHQLLRVVDHRQRCDLQMEPAARRPCAHGVCPGRGARTG
jgi:subtilisin-like proprotein convertase family protein